MNNTRITDLLISELIRDPLGLFGLASPWRYSLGNQRCPAILAAQSDTMKLGRILSPDCMAKFIKTKYKRMFNRFVVVERERCNTNDVITPPLTAGCDIFLVA